MREGFSDNRRDGRQKFAWPCDWVGMTTFAEVPHDVPTIDEFLAEPLEVGPPDVTGPLAVFPLFGHAPAVEYTCFAQGFERGVTVKELEAHASVNDLLVANGSGLAVLLYEGEEVLGAQQNRTFDVTALVAAGAKVKVPVSCVEVGRWDGRRHAETLRPAPQMAYPELRRLKNKQAREALAVGAEARASQSAVWSEIGAKSDRLDVDSPTGAMHDVFEARGDRLAAMTRAVGLHEGQIGAVAAIGGQIQVLDMVSRSDAFMDLHHAITRGYALDALEADEAHAPPLADVEGFVSLTCGSHALSRSSIGLGHDLRFAEDGVAGSGLVHDGELIQLSAFPEPGAAQAPRA